MTPEQRLDRLERIAGLMVRAGLRARRHSREQDEKINMIIDAQMKGDERFNAQMRDRDEKFNAQMRERDKKFDAQMRERDERFDAQMRERDERFGCLERQVEFVIDAQIRNEERFARLTESQMETNHRLDALIGIIKEGRNGESG